jgi:hypothetical protein
MKEALHIDTTKDPPIMAELWLDVNIGNSIEVTLDIDIRF